MLLIWLMALNWTPAPKPHWLVEDLIRRSRPLDRNHAIPIDYG